MAQRNRNEGLVVLLVALGAPLLYYLLAGKGKEKDAALIPNDLEGRVDLVVDALNRQFGLALGGAWSTGAQVLPPERVANSGCRARECDLQRGAIREIYRNERLP